MPLELALLPAIESAYNPMAYSRASAAGMWQFMPATGRHFNLRQTNFYDGRRDITASTNAALDYLTRLHDMFNGDWLLALAAYNAGEGAVKKNGGVPPYAETRAYVPKVLAAWQVAQGLCLTPPELVSDPCVFKVIAAGG